MLTVCGVAVAGRGRDERRWYDHCFVRLIAHVLFSQRDEACCGCGVVGSRLGSGVARWRLLTRRAWHGWYVACCCLVVRNTLAPLLFLYQSESLVVVSWSGGCGSCSAANACGAQHAFFMI